MGYALIEIKHPDAPMSALPPKADIAESDWHVRFVPKADILRRSEKWPV